MNEKREIRTIECQLSIREAAPDAKGESRTIAGTAIVFNRESQELDDWGEKFKEIILPEAVTMSFLNTQDVKLNLLHDRKMTIARCNKGEANSSLRLSVDQNGVNFEFDAPRCDLGDRALELVRTGVYSGCSFEFKPKDYEKRVEGDTVTIIHRSFEYLSSLTLGMDPAYIQTSVNVRELKGGTEETEEQKREREEREAQALREQEEREREEREAQALREQEEREREQRAIAAHSRRKREIEMFDIENNY